MPVRRLPVNRLRRIASVALLLVALGALSTLPVSAQTTGKTHTVRVGDNFFKPKRLKIVAGDKITFKWVGSAQHDVKVKKGPQKFESKLKSSGKFSRVLREPGKYEIYCTIHPGMTMKVKAKEAPPPTTTTSSVPPAT
jgi:plastocyanin